MMKPNLWIYADRTEQEKTAASLIIFGAEIFKRAKSIKEINILQTTINEIESKRTDPRETKISEFIFEFIIDSIRMLLFFENYMKAELILRDYCVHNIDGAYPGFKSLAKSQKSRPVKLREIQNIESFVINRELRTISHPAIKETTIGLDTLICNGHYYSNYEFDSAIRDIIKKLKTERNRLHLNESMQLVLSSSLIADLITINNFVDNITTNRINKNAP